MAEESMASTDEPNDEPTVQEPDEDTTVAELNALMQIPGALRIITNEVKPELRQDRDDPRSLPSDGTDLRDPNVFVQQHVTEVEGPDDKGRYLARSEDGAWVTGYPDALLSRLRQWRSG